MINHVLDNRNWPILLLWRRCSEGKLLGLLLREPVSGLLLVLVVVELARAPLEPAVCIDWVKITLRALDERRDELHVPFSTDLLCWRLRSIMIFLQMSLSVLAIVLAGVSHRKTWHMCRRVTRSRATYAKSLCCPVIGKQYNQSDSIPPYP